MDKKRQELIQAKLDEVNKVFADDRDGLIAEINDLDTMEICICIEWGDWKHSHAYANYIMRQHGFVKTDEQITEEDGDDAYSSIHYYEYQG